MHMHLLGNTALKVSEICLGSMTWGQQNSMKDAHAQLDYAQSRGLNFIDTAEMYSVPARAETYGATEKIIGEWLHNKGALCRDQIVVASKCAGPSRNAADLTWVRGDAATFSKADIQRGITGSLKRLQTDYIDLYQLHWPARNVPVFGGALFDATAERESVALEETLAALADEVKAGRIRYIGLSNETPWGLMRFLQLADTSKLARVVSIQNAYSLLNRVYEQGLSEIGFRENIGLLAYSPLAFGHLTGKYLHEAPDNARFKLFPQFGPRYGKPNVVPAVREYAALAAQIGISLTALSLAFCKSRFFVMSTIVGATTLAQLAENIDAFDVNLDTETLAAIDAIHLRYTNPAP